MERSGSQKALLVFSIIEIVAAVLALIAGIGSTALTGMIAGVGASTLEEVGLTTTEQAMGVTAMGLLSAAIIISAIWSLLCGIFGIRAANDNQKIMIVWVFTLIGLVLSVIGLIVAIVNGSFGSQAASLIITLIFDGILFWLANNIKREAGK